MSDLKYNDYVKITHPFFHDVRGRVIDRVSTAEIHPNEDRPLVKYEVEINYGPTKWFSEVYLEKTNA